MKILFAASECAPFVKTGGLADVVAALPKAIAKAGEDVRVALPLYREVADRIRPELTHVAYFYVNLGWRRQYCGIERLERDGITYYFIDNEYFFHRPYVYGLGGDEPERFTFFSRAVLEMLPIIGFRPDAIHCHDWQTGLIPALLRTQYRANGFFGGIAAIYTIHNLKYQGLFSLPLAEDLISIGEWGELLPNVEFYGQCSCMKAGISYADRITTVSPTYAQEIQTGYYGEGLDGLLRKKSPILSGVLNGIDTDEYDPSGDPNVAAKYSKRSFIVKKAENKRALQYELGLDESPDAPMIGIVSRLSEQKGLDLLERVFPEIMSSGAQFAALGMGENRYEELFRWAQWKYPGRVAARFEMNGALASRVYAGSDIFLMPSKFEPCGLSQLIALRYGALPVVRETGGLRDTVFPYNPETGEGNGFTFHDYNAHDMLDSVERAIGLYKNSKDVWWTLVKRAMSIDSGWDRSAKVYAGLYEEASGERAGKSPEPDARAATVDR